MILVETYPVFLPQCHQTPGFFPTWLWLKLQVLTVMESTDFTHSKTWFPSLLRTTSILYIYPCKCSQKCFLIPSFLPWFHLRCCIFRMILATKNWHQQMLLSVVGHFTGSMFDNEMAVKWSLQLWLSIIMSVVDWDYYHSYSLWYPYNPSILPMYYSITIWF